MDSCQYYKAYADYYKHIANTNQVFADQMENLFFSTLIVMTVIICILAAINISKDLF